MERRDDEASLEAAIIENMVREDLNPVEEARAVAALVEELGLTREEVGRRVGRSRVAISNLLRILDLPDDVLELLEEGTLSEGHGRAILLADAHTDRRRLAREAAAGGWSVRVTEDRARAANKAAGRGARSRGVQPTPAALHPDQREACAEIAETLSRRSDATFACAPAAPDTRPRSCSTTPPRRTRSPAACGLRTPSERRRRAVRGASPGRRSRARLRGRTGD